MRFLNLSQSHVAVIDAEDYPRLSRFRWYITRKRPNSPPYAVRYYRSPDGKRTNRPLQYDVLNLDRLPSGRVIDHINGDRLDCRKRNLRVCTVAENARNTAPARSKSSSRYRGVHYDKRARRWYAQIQHDHRRHYLGTFPLEYYAVQAYNLQAFLLHGRFGYCNHWSGPTINNLTEPIEPGVTPVLKKLRALGYHVPNINPTAKPLPRASSWRVRLRHPARDSSCPPNQQLLLPFM